MKRIISLVCFYAVMANFSALFSQETLIEFKRIYPEELERGGFELKSSGKVKIDATGFYESHRYREAALGNAWILDASTRDVVWEMLAERPDRDGLIQVESEISLPAGKYEAYYTSFPSYGFDDDYDGYEDWSDYKWHGFRDLFSRIRWSGGHNWRYFDEEFDKLHFIVRGNGKQVDWDELENIQEGMFRKALIAFDVRRPEERKTQAFSISRPTEIEVYAVGEANRDGNYDYGVILNTETLERIWELNYHDSERAGGAYKNRVSQKNLTLPAGEYAAIFVSDDSHSPREWNAAPPYDPAFWGMTITPVNASDRSNFQLKAEEPFALKNAIVNFTKLHDDEFRSYAFTVKRKLNVRILATGEGRKGDMFDYGWIVEAGTRKKIWEMDYYDTVPAGGGRKNRLADQTLTLEPGNYIAYFVTDDSHSYRDWNTAPPLLDELWGMAILPADKNFRSDDIAAFREEDDKNILVQIIRVRDHDHERQRFTLDKESDVRIYALGEGRRGGMYDYAWIEDARTGDLVWEMSYGRTDHAGGADKNRVVDDVVTLRAGEYIVFYETDDSHSYGRWNDAPPYDPEHWGVTLYLAHND